MTTVVGAGWLGKALAAYLAVRPVSRREFTSDNPLTSPVFVASGRGALGRAESPQTVLREELLHLRNVLDRCERIGVDRVVVLGSSDVCGVAATITGATPAAPTTLYGEVKAAAEEEVVRHRQRGLNVTSVRLAPVHGEGKRRTQLLVRAATWPLVPLPNGGSHSIGFVMLDDALRALAWLGSNDAAAVVSVGAGTTPLRSLLAELSEAQGQQPHHMSIPVPARFLVKLTQHRSPELVAWALRLASERTVVMEPPLRVSSIREAAKRLVNSSC